MNPSTEYHTVLLHIHTGNIHFGCHRNISLTINAIEFQLFTIKTIYPNHTRNMRKIRCLLPIVSCLISTRQR